MTKFRPQTEQNHAEAVCARLRDHRYDQIHHHWLTPTVLLSPAEHGEFIIHSLLYHHQASIIPAESWTKEVALAYIEGKPTPVQTLTEHNELERIKDIPFTPSDLNEHLRHFLLTNLDVQLPVNLLYALEPDLISLRNAYRNKANSLHEIVTALACRRILKDAGLESRTTDTKPQD